MRFKSGSSFIIIIFFFFSTRAVHIFFSCFFFCPGCASLLREHNNKKGKKKNPSYLTSLNPKNPSYLTSLNPPKLLFLEKTMGLRTIQTIKKSLNRKKNGLYFRRFRVDKEPPPVNQTPFISDGEVLLPPYPSTRLFPTNYSFFSLLFFGGAGLEHLARGT